MCWPIFWLLIRFSHKILASTLPYYLCKLSLWVIFHDTLWNEIMMCQVKWSPKNIWHGVLLHFPPWCSRAPRLFLLVIFLCPNFSILVGLFLELWVNYSWLEIGCEHHMSAEILEWVEIRFDCPGSLGCWTCRIPKPAVCMKLCAIVNINFNVGIGKK
jgi:hypothetical protein